MNRRERRAAEKLPKGGFGREPPKQERRHRWLTEQQAAAKKLPWAIRKDVNGL